jgi:hypothetical protein
MKGWKTFVFFGSVSLLGIVTMLQSANIQDILMPIMCHAPENAQIVSDECTAKVVKLAGAVITGVAVLGKVLRFITTSPVFKPEG